MAPLQFGRATLRSNERLQLESEFKHVFDSGKKLAGQYIVLVIGSAPDGELRFGVVCSRKYSTRAVIRNRARRLMRESFRLLKANVRPAHLVFMARQRLKGRALQEVQSEMLDLLRRADLWIG